MTLFRVYKDNELIAGPFASREGAYLECITREGDYVQEWDVAGNVVAHVTNAECHRHLQKSYPR